MIQFIHQRQMYIKIKRNLNVCFFKKKKNSGANWRREMTTDAKYVDFY